MDRFYKSYMAKNGRLLDKADRQGKSYASRDQYLAACRLGSYGQYLASSLWKNVRQKVFKKKGRLCVACGGVATQVHHLRYHRRDLLGQSMRYMVPICQPCHKAVEYDGTKKVSLKVANERLSSLMLSQHN